ncbi:MAG TPA: hypothetical protein VH877_14730, partial [Polyangia bacterium]|nr:hypothetical protein [Polyangia bacterium]
IDAYKNYLEVSLQVVPKEPLRDKAMASISRLRQDVERIAAERAARLRGEEEVEKEREARERRALEEEKKALQERVNRMMAEREEEKAKQKVLQARRSSQVKWGLGLAGAGLGIAGVGGALLGRVGVMAAEARILIQFDKVAAADLVIESEPFLLSGAILTACGASVATFGAIRVASAGRDGGALWVGMGPRELMFGGRF